MKKWRCTICNYIHEGDAPPDRCPICKAPASKFVEVVEDAPAATSQEPPTAGAVTTEADTPPRQPEARPAGAGGVIDLVKTTMARHHAHPVSVHIPNGVLPVVVLMFVLAAVFGASTLARAGFYNLVVVVAALPFVLFAGYVEWEKKYNRALTTIFQVKIIAASLASVLALINLCWFVIDSNVLESPLSWLFILLNLVMLAGVGVAGHLGGKLVFKD